MIFRMSPTFITLADPNNIINSANQRETCNLKLPIKFPRDSLEISVDRLNTIPKVRDNVKRDLVSLLEQRFYLYSRLSREGY